MTVKELLDKAREAITTGDLDLAEQHKNAAKALREIETFEADMDADIKAQNGPPLKSAGTLVVTNDETDKKAAMPWASLGEQLKAVYTAAVKPHSTDDRLKAQKAILGASEGVPADGGFLVQPNFSAEIFTLAHDSGSIMSRTRQIPIGPNSNGLLMNAIDETSRATGSRWGGVQAYWAAEGDTATATKPKFRQMELKLNKLIAAFYATDELLMDTTALGAVASQAVAEEMVFATEDAIWDGTGAGQPLGIMNAAALITVSKEVGQAADTIVVNNIVKMYARMWSRSRSNAVWFYNQDIEPQLLTLEFPVGAGGLPAYMPPGGLSASPYGSLLGRPMIPVEYASTLGSLGDIVLADFSQYLVINKGGVQGAESMHVQFLTDQMTYRWTYRVDGQSAWRSVLTPANGTNTLSPFVTLEAR